MPERTGTPKKSHRHNQPRKGSPELITRGVRLHLLHGARKSACCPRRFDEWACLKNPISSYPRPICVRSIDAFRARIRELFASHNPESCRAHHQFIFTANRSFSDVAVAGCVGMAIASFGRCNTRALLTDSHRSLHIEHRKSNNLQRSAISHCGFSLKILSFLRNLNAPPGVRLNYVQEPISPAA